MKHDLSRVFPVRPITDRKRFYLLSLTWGLPMNLAGSLVAAAMLISGHKMHRFGPCFYFEHGHNWGGMDWGMFIVVNKGAESHLLSHELGHAMQNCHFGLLMPFLVGFPSGMRYWLRRLSALLGKSPKTPYDSIWFEAQATAVGTEYLNVMKKVSS